MKPQMQKATNGASEIRDGNLVPQRLRCECMDNPLAEDIERPRLNCSESMSLLASGSGAGDTSPVALRIMPVGDSITVGYTDNPDWNVPFEFGYRSGLYSRLKNAGCPFQFVGTSGEPWEPWNKHHGDPSRGGAVRPPLDLRDLGQDHHEGYSGKDIAYIHSIITNRIAVNRPDVILLMIGINGINASSPAQLSQLVGTIVDFAPKVHLLVAQITPYRTYNADLFNYNTAIHDTLVPNFAAKGARISAVDLYTPFLADSADPMSIGSGLHANEINHPSAVLYDKMAQAWFESIMQLGLRKGENYG